MPYKKRDFPKSNCPLKATDKVLEYLAKRDHSEKELRSKLERRFESDAIEAAIEQAHERKWMCEPHELSQKVARQLHLRQKGHLFIQNYLKEKGLPELAPEKELELEKAYAVASKKFDTAAELDYNARQKLGQLLLRRGFEFDTINSLTDQWSELNEVQ